jgi:hypothetical protein
MSCRYLFKFWIVAFTVTKIWWCPKFWCAGLTCRRHWPPGKMKNRFDNNSHALQLGDKLSLKEGRMSPSTTRLRLSKLVLKALTPVLKTMPMDLMQGMMMWAISRLSRSEGLTQE